MTAMLGLVTVMMTVTLIRRRRLGMSVTPRRHFRRRCRRRWRRRRRRRFVNVDVVFFVADVTLRRRRPRPLVLDQVLDPLVHAAALALRGRLVVAGVRVRVLQDPLRRLLVLLVVGVLNFGHRGGVGRHFTSTATVDRRLLSKRWTKKSSRMLMEIQTSPSIVTGKWTDERESKALVIQLNCFRSNQSHFRCRCCCRCCYSRCCCCCWCCCCCCCCCCCRCCCRCCCCLQKKSWEMETEWKGHKRRIQGSPKNHRKSLFVRVNLSPKNLFQTGSEQDFVFLRSHLRVTTVKRKVTL